MGFRKSNVKREVHSNTSLPQKTREISNNQPDFTSKATSRRTEEPKVSRRKEIIKTRAEINEK